MREKTVAGDDAAVETYVPRRGRPTAAQAEAIAEHILGTAQGFFLSDGYAQTTMEAVAAAAGISKGTLYARYSTKADLFHALVSDRLAAWSRRVPGRQDTANVSLFDYLYRRGTDLLAAMSDPEIRAFTHLVNAESRQFPELAVDFRTEAYEKVITEIAGDIESLAARSGWPTSDAKGTAAIFINALTGWWQSHSHEEDIPVDSAGQYTARLVSLMIGGRAAF